jgi:antitoxin VapB
VALNIKDEQTDRLARELAELTGESITVATRRAIEDRLRSVRVSLTSWPGDEPDGCWMIVHPT